jgi:hypothetical protein
MKLLIISAVFVIASILIVLGLSKKKTTKPEVKPVVEPVQAKPEPIEVKPEPVAEVAQELVVEEPVATPAKKKPAVKKAVKNVK